MLSTGINNIIIRIKILNNIIRIIHNTLDLDPIIFPDLSGYIQIFRSIPKVWARGYQQRRREAKHEIGVANPTMY